MVEDTEDKKNIFGTSKLGQALANSEKAAIGFDVGMKAGGAAFDTLSAATGFERDSVDAVADSAADVAGQFGPWGKCAALAIQGLNDISKATGEKYAEQDLNTGSSGFADFSTEGKQFRGNPLNPLAAFTKSGASAAYEQQMERQRKKFAQAKSVVQEQEKEIKARQQAMDNTNQRVKNQLGGGQNYDAILSKDGSKLYPVNNFTPITDYAQDFFNSQAQTVASYKDGGSVIPDGELHKNRHNIEAVRPELEGQITHKGIPVITEEEDPKTGDIKVTQHAEIECGEVILELSITKKLEKLYKEGTDEAAIEAGRILAKELITNTEDNTGELLDGYQN